MLIVGEQEASKNQVAPRKKGEGDLGAMDVDEFGKMIQQEVTETLAAFEI